MEVQVSLLEELFISIKVKPQTTIDHFKLPEKKPQIVVSVDMLDTGIDVPDILNLVFFKSVKSSSKYWQMVGRGTRLRPDIFGSGEDETTFYMFDYCGNIEFFGDHPEGIQPGETTSLTQRVFMLKMKLASTLEPFAADDELNNYRSTILNELHQEILKLNENHDSFINRPHLRLIETFADRNNWNVLMDDKIREINKNLTPLLLNFNTDFDARRFDLIMYQLTDAFLKEEKALPKLISLVKNTATALLKQTSLPQVMAKKELLKTVLNDTFWQNADVNGLNNVREELREIMKFLQKEKQRNAFTNFADEMIGEIEIVDILTPINNLEVYYKRAAAFIRKHANYLVIDKIKHNQPISLAELELIKKLLFDEEPETAAHLDDVLKGQNFTVFIRSIIGLDAKVAKELFADFINRPGISAAQMSFMDTLIDFLTQNGTIDRNMLFERPFTDIDQQGVLGVFKDEDAVKIIHIIDGFNRNPNMASQI
ncbi:MAG: type I restriction-modification enzyme R subunit C-terminal domain-containing protein [Janthinobacterium lividum]